MHSKNRKAMPADSNCFHCHVFAHRGTAIKQKLLVGLHRILRPLSPMDRKLVRFELDSLRVYLPNGTNISRIPFGVCATDLTSVFIFAMLRLLPLRNGNKTATRASYLGKYTDLKSCCAEGACLTNLRDSASLAIRFASSTTSSEV